MNVGLVSLRLYTAFVMDTGTLVAVVAGASVGAMVVAIVLRRRSRDQLRAARAQLDQARETLDKHERSSKEDRQVQDLILSSMQDGVLLLDPDGDAAFANQALEQLLGYPPEDATHLFPVAIRGAVERAAFTGADASILVETGQPPRHLRVVAAPAGAEGAVLVIASDVTEARRLEAIRRDFVANASHELKTPAAAIRATAETLHGAAVDDPEAARRFASQLEKNAVRLSRIVEDLLDLSRLEGGSELREAVSLGQVVAEEVDRAIDDAHAAGVELTIAARGDATVEGSTRDLALLVRNLVDNAIRYTDGGGSVNVALATQRDDVLLSVADTGGGIPAADLPRIFERFFRVDRARSRATGGTGLGLAIVRHVAENHGGTVSVTSELGRGSTFTVTLPRVGD